jgi:uncharacterized protein
MTTLDTIILKLSSRCNLACTYCYEYFAGDETWKNAPKAISTLTLKRMGQRIREYCADAGISGINVVLHGGEPLIVGPKRLETFLTALRDSAAPAKIRYSVQTNGTPITRDICDVLCRHSVLVGISLDGDSRSNSKRVDLKGEPTLNRIIDKIALLKAHAAHLFGGILCVVNLDADPIETLTSLCAHEPPEIDFLHPLVTHDHVGPDRRATAIKFGNWMVAAMNHWIDHPRFSQIKVRIFEDALQSTISMRPQTDWFGPRTVSYLVVETDGNYNLSPQLKIIGGESQFYRSVGRSVFNCSIEEAILLSRELLKNLGGDVLPSDCTGCKWSAVCAGSQLSSRHSFRRGFNNKSVYCEGIQALLNTAHNAMLEYKEGKARSCCRPAPADTGRTSESGLN